MSGDIVAITGASGFIGRHVVDHFRQRGWIVRALVRDPGNFTSTGPGVEVHHCDLPDRIEPAAFEGARAVIHAAYATRHTTLSAAKRINEEGTLRVLGMARSAGVERFVFVSSTSAHEEAQAYYGRSKFLLENRLDPARDLALRCGLVLGSGGGLFDRLVTSLRRSSIVPLFDGGRQKFQTVHVEDLCAALQQALERNLNGRLVVAHPEPVTMRYLLRGIADRIDRPCHFLPLPMAPVLIVLRTLERTGIRLPVSSENILALRSMREQPSAADLESIGLTLRSTDSCLDQLLG